MTLHKIPEKEIHDLALDLAKRIPINQPSYEYEKIVDEFMKAYNRIYDALQAYNKKSE